jgi:hypothetical protein
MGALGWKGDGNAVGEILFCSHQLLLSHFSRPAQEGRNNKQRNAHTLQYIAILFLCTKQKGTTLIALLRVPSGHRFLPEFSRLSWLTPAISLCPLE